MKPKPDAVDELIATWEREHRAIDQITEGSNGINRIGFVAPADVKPGDVVLDQPEAIEYMVRWFKEAADDPKLRADTETWGPTAERTVLIKRRIEVLPPPKSGAR